MKTKALVLTLIVVGLVGAYGLYHAGMNRGMQMAARPSSGTMTSSGTAPSIEKTDSTGGKKPLYWHDPMFPQQKFDKPGKSPFMDMQLVPVYADGEGDGSNVTISPRVQQNLGVRTVEAIKGTLAPAVEAVGNVAYNERNIAVVQARANGFVEKLYVRAPLDPVKKGQMLAELYVPDWVAAQEEYLSVKRMAGTGFEDLREGARQRMRIAGMTDEQIRRVEASGKVQSRITITAPVSGVVAELGAREGMTVMAGALLFRINGLQTIWVNAEVPEGLAAQVRLGNTVEARTPALPGIVFKGKVSAILPEVNPATRTLKARVEVANPEGQLVPGMFATVNFPHNARKDIVLIPSEAIIQTGQRSVVIVAQGEGKFVPVDVETGIETNGQTEIRKGLEAGQKIVVSGQFLLDSEASLKGVTTRMSDGAAPERGMAGSVTHHGEGKVEAIGKDEITLSHGPIPSLQWGPMTMGFKTHASGLPKNISVGDNVSFDIRQIKNGKFEIVAIARAPKSMEEETKNKTNGNNEGMRK
ncbi:MAG: efflux RND transporter periplasmic adaptor subunit [Pseudomonadota bacterium]